MTPAVGVLAALTIAALATGCSARADDSEAATGDVTVFAAASLQSTFTELAARFENDHPGTEVTLNFAGSSDLVAQLAQGAPADVFASADATTMTRALDDGLVAGAPQDFATNTLTIVTPAGNPAGITSFEDLTDPAIQVVVCAPQVPCGTATEKVENAAGVTLTPVSEESAVTDVLGKITSGQADAGLVYVTDAAAAGDRVTTIPFPESSEAVNTYPIATLTEAADPPAAQRFVELVTGPQGREVLSAAGFGTP
ncbi:molybdate ABC transporter substrate-binding protein [Mycobacterium sp. ITM-2016-00317]|uniref:molybdate ABC transporter substrate-binding protein n=1 Tax=Mycobacterium sp. ITM-2016-00317 TaxID=2099694 RepID=UPI000D43F168|nr:molybdate ABC transporter substrate-binding protein [Mycobacterium sp. ITM-2016-00317]WNG89748.1 molybdate ABC transporter substrate-binding protein [Mycobacterium sp. ITM-2016-00317]